MGDSIAHENFRHPTNAHGGKLFGLSRCIAFQPRSAEKKAQ
jgi:hypothetical protein